MKLIDQSPIKASDSPVKKLQNTLEGILDKGFNWDEDLKAQELVASHLSRLLDSKYTLLRGIRLAVDDVPFPLVLIGPPGVLAINPRGLKGVFQAKSESWLELDRGSQQYKPASRNLITESLDLAKKLDTFLGKEEQQVPQSQPVLFLAHPGVYVETNRPAVRIIRVDGIDRFAGGLVQSEAVLDAVQIQALVDQLTGAFEVSLKEKQAQMQKDQELRLEKKASSRSSQLLSKIKLNRSQVILLGVMGAVEILLLVAFAVIVLLFMR